MEYVIGIDGGGTKTRMKIADLEGHFISLYEGGPSNINAAKVEEVENNLRYLIRKGTQEIHEPLFHCRGVCIGTAGAGRVENRKMIQEMMKNIGYKGEVLVTDDAKTALYGGTGKREGVILISGTGSICYGQNKKGESHRTGGWGHIIGDEGSGYYIGRAILQHVMKSYDLREPDTLLTSMVLQHLRLTTPEQLIEYTYHRQIGKKEMAELAVLINEPYAAKDKTAIKIVREVVQELFLCVSAVIDKLRMRNEPISMVINGSVLTKSQCIQVELITLMKREYPLVEISHMKEDAAWGAVLMALDYIRGGNKWQDVY